MPPDLRAIDLGRTAYEATWELQKRLVQLRAEDGCPDLLLFTEHDEVVTQGRRAQTPDRDPGEETAGVTAAGIQVVQVERGGAATYHGPGQLVGYPIVKLRAGERDLHAFLRHIEGGLIEALNPLGLAAGRKQGLTGVWVGEKKLASIGIACRSWVTYHGFALNLTTDLSRFGLFNPCDLDAQVMASVTSVGAEVDRDALRDAVHGALASRLGRAATRGALP